MATLKQAIEKALADAAKVQTEALSNEPDVWDLLDPDPAVSEVAWARYMRKLPE